MPYLCLLFLSCWVFSRKSIFTSTNLDVKIGISNPGGWHGQVCLKIGWIYCRTLMLIRLWTWRNCALNVALEMKIFKCWYQSAICYNLLVFHMLNSGYFLMHSLSNLRNDLFISVFVDWSFEVLAWWLVSVTICWWYGCWGVHCPCSVRKANEGMFLLLSHFTTFSVHVLISICSIPP